MTPAAEVDGHRVALSNLDREIFPGTGFTKGNLIGYYQAVAPAMVPHLAERPLTMRRFPEGAGSEGFWEKRCPEHRPDWIETASIWSGSAEEEISYCVANDAATLVWAANLAAIELHTSLATAKERATPTSIVFDLDPGAPADVNDCAEIALVLRSVLAETGLESWIKTSGSKGLQLYVPLNSNATYDETSRFAHSIARTFEAGMPDRVVSKMKKSLRGGKVLIDWSQNSEHKTTVCAYSMRATPEPSVSTPLTWEEVEAGELSFGPEEVLDRIETIGDLFQPLLEEIQVLPPDY